MPHLHIQPATDNDRPEIWQMLRPVFRAGETYCLPRDIDEAAALDYWAGGSHSVFVARDETRALGTYFLCPNQQGGGAHVCNCGFVTAPDAQGSGVARAMLTDALIRARAAGFAAMQFNFVVASNTRALKIWHDFGFAQVGRLPRAFDHPRLGLVDALVLFRFL